MGVFASVYSCLRLCLWQTQQCCQIFQSFERFKDKVKSVCVNVSACVCLYVCERAMIERQIEEDSDHQRGEKRYSPGGGKDGKISCTKKWQSLHYNQFFSRFNGGRRVMMVRMIRERGREWGRASPPLQILLSLQTGFSLHFLCTKWKSDSPEK